ncbi:Bacteriophage-related protein (plasmid) [Leptospira biflexa serovar Patoc strain 'Patoc 1 (Ames)']|nr:phage Gp37/Gp68 family protein [Leptospira biflexa]ABZ96121.1 Bacteriophage-related protein [Leptospira biflexa serovar Patoc strain 'Patoc 1 (Ames)']
MSSQSKIEWTDATWNPTRGCTKISAGCKHCYAETFSERFRGVQGHPFEFGFDLRLVPEKLYEPIKWQTSKKIFVNSMSDLFHKDIPDDFIYKVFSIMKIADWHIYQVLTKRPERMKLLFDSKLKEFSKLKHIWIGTSVENEKHGKPRIEILRKANVSVRFLSIEPLLEDLGKVNLEKMDWVIVGGESGPKARLMESSWVESIQKQCKSENVPFFFKQWGGVRKHLTGRVLKGQTFNAMPKFEIVIPPNRTGILDLLKEAKKVLV